MFYLETSTPLNGGNKPRDMPPARGPTPAWLLELHPGQLPKRLPIKALLEDSLFYPASGLDHRVLNKFKGSIYSYVYADYLINKDDVINSADSTCRLRLNDYRVLFHQEIEPSTLIEQVPFEPLTVPPSLFHEAAVWQAQSRPYCHWIVFERKADALRSTGLPRISLLVICGEMSAVYHALYRAYHCLPRVLVLKSIGYATLGCGWEPAYSNDSLFKRVVATHPAGLPRYLYCGCLPGFCKSCARHACWSEYKIPVGSVRQDPMLWERDKDIATGGIP